MKWTRLQKASLAVIAAGIAATIACRATRGGGAGGDPTGVDGKSRAHGASGLVVTGDSIFIVRDYKKGHYYRLATPELKVGEAYSIGDELDEHDFWKGARQLEDVALLFSAPAQSTTAPVHVAISEEDAGDGNGDLIDADGVVARYDHERFGKTRNKGLEGVDVRGLGPGLAEVVVVLERGDGGPVLFAHELDLDWLARLREERELPLRYTIELGAPGTILPRFDWRNPSELRIPSVLHVSAPEPGFLVILQDTEDYAHKWLVLLDHDGEARSRVHLAELGVDAEKNWEGLAWLDDSRIVMVSDNASGSKASGKTYLVALDAPFGSRRPSLARPRDN
ncbi:MAG: hypothetical protein GY711_32945 [bacterium]|nr:hypothetical protein [bacterium]